MGTSFFYELKVDENTMLTAACSPFALVSIIFGCLWCRRNHKRLFVGRIDGEVLSIQTAHCTAADQEHSSEIYATVASAQLQRALPAVPLSLPSEDSVNETKGCADIRREDDVSELYAAVSKQVPVRPINYLSREHCEDYSSSSRFEVQLPNSSLLRQLKEIPCTLSHVECAPIAPILDDPSPFYVRFDDSIDEIDSHMVHKGPSVVECLEDPVYNKIGSSSSDDPYSVIHVRSDGSDSDPLYSQVKDVIYPRLNEPHGPINTGGFEKRNEITVDYCSIPSCSYAARANNEVPSISKRKSTQRPYSYIDMYWQRSPQTDPKSTQDKGYAVVKPEDSSNLYAKIERTKSERDLLRHQNGRSRLSFFPRILTDRNQSALQSEQPSASTMQASSSSFHNISNSSRAPVEGGSEFENQQRPTSVNGRREPSYRLITLRESLEALRNRIYGQRQAVSDEPRNTVSFPVPVSERLYAEPLDEQSTAHYYSTISEHNYEIVPPTTNQELYERVSDILPSTSHAVDSSSSVYQRTNVSGTVCYDSSEAGHVTELPYDNIGNPGTSRYDYNRNPSSDQELPIPAQVRTASDKHYSSIDHPVPVFPPCSSSSVVATTKLPSSTSFSGLKL